MEKELMFGEKSKNENIILKNDENNINYYKELDSREPRTFNQSIDYYDLLKQQIKLYKKLNASLKEEIETVKKCKKVKQLEELNEINNLASINKERDEMNILLTSENQDKMRQELTENELKISDLQTKNKILEESVSKLKNTLDRANNIFPNFMEKIEAEDGSQIMDFANSYKINTTNNRQNRR